MSNVAKGILEVGTDGNGEVVINHPDLMPDENGVGHIVFSVEQAHALSRLLAAKAHDAYEERFAIQKAERFKTIPPVDRNARVLTNGTPVTEDHRELLPSGQQKDYVVLSEEERRKGFVRPVRRTYRHLACGATTTMGTALAETYARDPGFYSGTFCCNCGTHFPLDQFVWPGDGSKLGS